VTVVMSHSIWNHQLRMASSRLDSLSEWDTWLGPFSSRGVWYDLYWILSAF
jgi:hypothetical protein